MKKHLLTLTFGICSTMLAFTACKKDKDAEPNQAKEILCLPDSINASGGKISLIYNDQRQLIKLNEYGKDGNITKSSSYTYSGNKFIETFFREGKLQRETEYILNDKGYVEFAYAKEYFSTINYDTTQYTYNNDDRLIMEVSKDNYSLDSILYTYKDGNLVSQILIDREGKSVLTFTYTNLINKQNVFENPLLIPGLFGKSSKNLVEKEIDQRPYNQTFTTTYTYQLDSDGYLTNSAFVVLDSKDLSEPYYTWNSEFHYDCK